MIVFSGNVSASGVNSTNTTPVPAYNNISVNTSNNGSYYIQDLGGGGGLNAVHISTNSTSGANYGQYTTTTNMSGVFYVTDTGGRGYQDDVILMIAVNGTIPDNFAVHITASGYTWIPEGYNTAPAIENITYHAVSIDETFYKSDFIYGPQNWKPAGGNVSYPIFYGEDMTDPSNIFYVMFIDLKAGLLGSNYNGNGNLIDYGTVKVNYSFDNLYSLAAFNVYAWNANTTWGAGMGWTNSILPGQTGGPSGYSVKGSPKPAAAFTTNATKGIVPLSIQFTDKSAGGPTSWKWDFGDGTTSTLQNPVHTYNTAGNYTVKLTVTNVYGSSETTQLMLVQIVNVSSSLESGVYNTTKTVYLTAGDNLYPNPSIYYTLNGSDPTTGSTVYTGPITFSSEGTSTLKFIAVDSAGNVSDTVTMTYTIDKTSPIASVSPAGSIYNTRKSVTLSAGDNTDPDPVIYYTTDGTDPRTSSTRTKYSAVFLINTTTTLKFAAVDDAGNWSPVYSSTYTMEDIAAPSVSADLPGGFYTSDQAVKLSAADEMDLNPKIYYTLDGNDPTTNSTLYTWPISINIVGTTVLKFIAVDAAGHISNITTVSYTLDKPGAGGTWNSTILDNSGTYNSIALDKSGNPHIAYYQVGQLDSYPKLNYTYKDSTGWHTETVDSVQAGAGFYVSLALDSSGNPHMVYFEVFGPNTVDKLKYAYKDSTGWHITILDQNSYISYINLVLYNDQPRISYYNNSANSNAGELQYMYKNGTKWVIEDVTPKSPGGHWNSLAVDSEGNPRISYYDTVSGPVQGSLRYAERTADGLWKITIVDGNLLDPLNVGVWNSLALDSSGNPCISYCVNNGSVESLKYAYWNGTQWITEIVDKLDSLSSKLVLTSSNSPIIVYQDATSQYMKYAYKEGSKWIINNIDTVDCVGQWISLTLNSSGVPYVSYTTANSRLKYAYLVPFVVNASPVGGNYNTTKTVTLTSTGGTTIYYTKDGSDPRTSGTRVKYAVSILINSTTTLKFAAVDSASNWSSVRTETYTIPDIIAPTVTGVDPANNAVNVSTSKTVTVTFNEPIKLGSGAIGVKNLKTGQYIPLSASVNGNTLTINFKNNLTEGTQYMLMLGSSITDLSGNQLKACSTTFTTATSDTTAPTVTDVDPANNAVNVATTKTVTVTFNEPIKLGSGAIGVKNLKTGQYIPLSASVNGNTLIITFGDGLTEEAQYMLLLSPNITDLYGNPLKNYVSRFTTGSTH